jgi:hypothetical protein
MKLIFFLILSGTLYITNPTTDDFNFYLKQEVESRVKEDNPFTKLLIGGFFTEIIRQGIYRKDYLLFSKYTVDTSLIAAFKQGMPSQVNFIGIFGKFIPTSDISLLK